MADNEDNGANAVSLKLPQFWTRQPEVWFTQAEAQFAIRNITADTTKYHYVVAALDQDTATRILDLLQTPPAQDQYQGLKNRLLKTFSLSELQRANLLLDMPDLGDDAPSVLMDKMLTLLGSHEPCFLFRQLFLRRMPEDIRATLVHSKIQDARALAEAADQLWQARQSQASAIRRVGAGQAGTAATSSKPRNSDLCFYHSRFGPNAKKCNPPCKYSATMASGNELANRQ